jgi:hypothetical protein
MTILEEAILASELTYLKNQGVQEMICLPIEWSHRPFCKTGDRQVQQLNVNEYYELGKQINSIERLVVDTSNSVSLSSIAWSMFLARWKVQTILVEPCALLPASQRAANGVIAAINILIPEEVEDIFKIEKTEQVYPWQLSRVTDAINSFETVLKNDMPEMSTFAVVQIGIYRTEDLINKSNLQIDESVRGHLLDLASKDIVEAGKCLAFRVPTAAAFHLSRAIETGMNQYYESLTGSPFGLKDAARNWAVKTKALVEAGAEEKITEFLVHIRKSYRNPITHPDEILESSEAFNFFPQSISVISMMLAAVKAIDDQKQLTLPGLGNGLGVTYAAELGALALGSVRSDNEENPLGIEAGTPETT